MLTQEQVDLLDTWIEDSKINFERFGVFQDSQQDRSDGKNSELSGEEELNRPLVESWVWFFVIIGLLLILFLGLLMFALDGHSIRPFHLCWSSWFRQMGRLGWSCYEHTTL